MSHWTDELLNLMVVKLAERKKREAPKSKGLQDTTEVSDHDLFAQMGVEVKTG